MCQKDCKSQKRNTKNNYRLRIFAIVSIIVLAFGITSCNRKELSTEDDYADSLRYQDQDTSNSAINRIVDENNSVSQASIEESLQDNTSNSLIKGNVITLGTYEQDNNPSNGPKPIEWIILSVEDNRILVASKYCLDYLPFKDGDMSRDLSWEHSTLRNWLNNDFFLNAFTVQEQEKIRTTTVSRSKNIQTNMEYKETIDKIFILSYEEATSLFVVADERACEPTAYVKALTENSKYASKNYWWLRTPGFGATQAAYIDSDGFLELINGIRLDERALVRPAFWMQTD